MFKLVLLSSGSLITMVWFCMSENGGTKISCFSIPFKASTLNYPHLIAVVSMQSGIIISVFYPLRKVAPLLFVNSFDVRLQTQQSLSCCASLLFTINCKRIVYSNYFFILFSDSTLVDFNISITFPFIRKLLK
jgi:hypothetical protein